MLITGGASGIGAAMVTAFAEQGARVAFLDVADAAAEALCEGLGEAPHPPLYIRCDLTDIAALQTAVERVGRELGDVGVLVNNAARDDRQELDDVAPGDWRASMAVNLDHLFFAAQAVRPHMQRRGGGSIVNFASVAGMGGALRMVSYSTAKAAIIGLTKSLAKEFGPDNIRVNAIAPGAVMTERQLKLWFTEESAAAIADRQLIRRRLLPEDIASTALFLASDDAAMITKQCLVVDAGLT